MLNQLEVEKLIASVPKSSSPEDHRAAASVAIGIRDDKSLAEIVKYYGINKELAMKWWTFFGLDGDSKLEKKKRGNKSSTIETYIKAHIGDTVSSADIIEGCEISTPTFYNFMNANRGYFKRVNRGLYTIVDPVQERKEAKNV
jgi:hypothetical protein